MTWTEILDKLRRYRKYDQTGLVIIWHGESRFYYQRDWCCADDTLLSRVPREDLDALNNEVTR